MWRAVAVVIIIQAMRYTLIALIFVLLAATAIAGCFFGDTATPARSTPDLQATVDAALARAAAGQRPIAATATATPAPDAAAQTNTAPAATPTPAGSPTPRPTVPPTPVASAYTLAKVRNWGFANQTTPVAVARISSIPWIADGLNTLDEFNAAERLVNIAANAPATLNALLDSGFADNTLEPLHLPALLSLARMAQDRPQRLEQLTGAGWFRDGLTDAETAIVATLYERSRFLSPEFDYIVGNPESLNVEFGATTNRAGETVPIAIIRAGSIPDGSPVMETAQSAVSVFEEIFDAPFPTPAIVIHVTDYVAGTAAGTNYQTHVTLKPEIDANEQPDFSRHAVFHEIAHYYLYAEPTWYTEGGADFAASYARRATAGVRCWKQPTVRAVRPRR